MVMELGSTRWTDNSPHPFGPAPGSGMAGTRWTSTVPHPFAPAPGAGLSAYKAEYTSGFAAEPADGLVPAPPPGQSGVTMDPILVLGKGPFAVRKEPIKPDEVPSMVVHFRYTDRGGLTKAMMDKGLHAFLKKAGFKVSKATKLQSVPVTWRWEYDKQADFYFPVVLTPKDMSGMRYSGSAVSLPVYTADADTLAKLPRQIWVYTFAVTSAHETMTDGEAAQVVTLLKQAMVNMAKYNAYANVELVVKGAPRGVFGSRPAQTMPQPVKGAFSALLLLVAYNMVAPHIGSEVL